MMTNKDMMDMCLIYASGDYYFDSNLSHELAIQIEAMLCNSGKCFENGFYF